MNQGRPFKEMNAIKARYYINNAGEIPDNNLEILSNPELYQYLN